MTTRCLMSRTNDNTSLWGCVFWIVLVLLFVFSSAIFERVTYDEINTEVVRFEALGENYMVYTEDEVFVMGDSLAYFTWDASDRYNKLKENTDYNLEVCGWRIPFLSKYRKIVALEELN